MTARRHAQRLVEKISPAVRAALAASPADALDQHFGLRVRAVDAPEPRGDGGTCDGMSSLRDKLVLYRSTPGSRRENFTLLHELGHFLSRSDAEVVDWAGEQENSGRAREEVCDRVAGLLLLPKTAVQAALRNEPPCAAHMVALYEGSNASRYVCAIALAEEIPCQGFVAVVHRPTRSVTYAARVEDTRPSPWRGTPIPTGHDLNRLSDGAALRTRSWWPFADGVQQEYFLDACVHGQYAYAVFASRDLWNVTPFHGYDAVEDRPSPPGSLVTCRSCGREGVSYRYQCETCGQVPCRFCDACECTRRAAREAPCKYCFLVVPKRRLTSGVCDECIKRGRKP